VLNLQLREITADIGQRPAAEAVWLVLVLTNFIVSDYWLDIWSFLWSLRSLRSTKWHRNI